MQNSESISPFKTVAISSFRRQCCQDARLVSAKLVFSRRSHLAAPDCLALQEVIHEAFACLLGMAVLGLTVA